MFPARALMLALACVFAAGLSAAPWPARAQESGEIAPDDEETAPDDNEEPAAAEDDLKADDDLKGDEKPAPQPKKETAKTAVKPAKTATSTATAATPTQVRFTPPKQQPPLKVVPTPVEELAITIS